MKKAVQIMEACGKITLSDDSGLEIDYMDKAPGVYSARFMGEDTPYTIKNAKILEMLEGVPDEKRGEAVCAYTITSIVTSIVIQNGAKRSEESR